MHSVLIKGGILISGVSSESKILPKAWLERCGPLCSLWIYFGVVTLIRKKPQVFFDLFGTTTLVCQSWGEL